MGAELQTQNKHMDCKNENEEGDYFPIGELNGIKVMKIEVLFGIMTLQFQKRFTDFDVMFLNHTLVSVGGLAYRVQALGRLNY